MDKPILKLFFRPSGSPIMASFLFFFCLRALIELRQRGRKIHGVEIKFSCDFRIKSPFISETVREAHMVY